MKPSSKTPGKPNRLAQETSPYLQQHALNPVDWYPWGEEAIRTAREQDKPIFLSIGYSACHWCHVMEHESFENEAIAALMNTNFVNIKVDREERPDLDQIYMNAVTALTGHGGWPMSVFLTPQLQPFFGGTYWPPEPRGGMPGFRDLIARIREVWDTRRDDVQQNATALTEAVARSGSPQGERAELTAQTLEKAARQLIRSSDRTYGGFGHAPKFPHPMDLRLLLRAWKRFGNQEALETAELALDHMARGGIYDHLGGGFHRYSTDAQWLVPHFEKMLYDNALLASAYLDAFQVTRNADYARVARETLDYVLREMTQPQGGFYSTQDADSEGEEGKFFVWTEDEINRHLPSEDARIFSYCYDVTPRGNWEGHTILNRVKPHAQAARVLGIAEDELDAILDRCRRTLFEVRKVRVAPGRDDKILVSWNGLMIAAMAHAASVLDDARYAEAASNAADFILNHMQTPDGRLLHSFKDGRARFAAYLDDYSCLIDGLVELYQATFEPRYVEEAVRLAEQMIAHFRDREEGGFFYTADDHEELIARNKDSQDGATPSGNSMAATALLKLARLCARTDFEREAEETLAMFSGQLAQVPASGGQALIALDFQIGPAKEIVVAEADRREDVKEILDAIACEFVPNKVLAVRPAGASDEVLPPVLKPLLAGKAARGDAAAIYVCERGTCHAPVVGVDAVLQQLKS